MRKSRSSTIPGAEVDLSASGFVHRLPTLYASMMSG